MGRVNNNGSHKFATNYIINKRKIPVGIASKSEKAEFYLLLSSIFFLPLLEAPKNISLLFFIILWVANRIKNCNFGGKITGLDISVLLLVSSGYITAIFTEIHGKEWSGPNNLLLIGIILILIYRSNYNAKQLKTILLAIISSTAIAVIYSHIQLYLAKDCLNCAFELKSVGHVNHSAIYVLLAFGASAAYLFAYWDKSSKLSKFALITSTVLFAITCYITHSRAAAGGVFIILTFFAFAYIPKNKKISLAVITTILLAIGFTFIAKPTVLTKHISNSKRFTEITPRERIRNTGYTAWKKYPIFGVGMKNYNLITLDKIKAWSKEMGEEYNEKDHLYISHAHNLYINTAAEKGLLGLLSLLAFLITCVLIIIKQFPRKHDSADKWLFWGAASSAFVTTTAIGFVNTTLHHEHGILTAILLATFFCYSNRDENERK